MKIPIVLEKMPLLKNLVGLYQYYLYQILFKIEK